MAERGERVDVMFAGGLEVGAHGDERFEVVVAAKRAADLVVDLDHSKGSFCEVVAERDPSVGKASQDLVLFVAEPTGEVVGVALPSEPAAGSASSWQRAGRAERERGRDGLGVVGPDLRGDCFRDSSFARVSGNRGRCTSGEETLPDGCRPGLVGVDFGGGVEVA